MNNKYAPFFAAYNASVKKGNPYSKEEIINQFTSGRTKSLKDLSDFELGELIRSFQKLSPPEDKGKADKMRKAILAIFYSMGKDVQAAKNWAEKQGVRGVKKEFNAYTTGELYVLIGLAEKIKSGWEKTIRNTVKNMNQQ